MIRKYFKRHLPSTSSIRENKFIRLFGPLLTHHNLWHLHRRSVAGGVAAGLLSGLIPGPLQIITASLLAIIFKVNLPVAMLTTLYTNPFTIVPLYLLAYSIGSLFTGEQANNIQVPQFDWSWSNLPGIFPQLIDWMLSLGETLAIGLLIQGVLFAASGYLAVRWLWRLYVVRAWRQRKRMRAVRVNKSPG